MSHVTYVTPGLTSGLVGSYLRCPEDLPSPRLRVSTCVLPWGRGPLRAVIGLTKGGSVEDTRTVRAVIEFDLGLNPLNYSIFLRDDGDLVKEQFDHFGAFMDLPECVSNLMHELAKQLVFVGWWR